jgi:ubiquinone biosynthesis protein
MSSSELTDRRRVVEQQLGALGRPRPARRAPPPEGQLGADEQPAGRLREALADLGPVFAGFGRYLSSRLDLLPRRDCVDLAGTDDRAWASPQSDVEALVLRQLGGVPERRFMAFDRVARTASPWTQQHDAWLATGAPVVVTIVRPDAGDLLLTDLPLLPLLAPWLDAPPGEVAAAIDDFSLTLRSRLDQTHQATSFIRLFEDAQAGGALDAPRCYRDYCAPGILTLERIDGIAIADALGIDATRPAEGAIDRDEVARQLASAWLRQAFTGNVVPFDFDLHDVRLRADRLVLMGGALEPMSTSGRAQFLSYLVAAAADDPDATLAWITSASVPGAGSQPEVALRRRIRQVVPFRDGEWSGDNRLAEYLLVQWRATREAGWRMLPHQLHLYRGIHAVSAATTRLVLHRDALRAALDDERLRLGLSQARDVFDAGRLPAALEELAQDLVQLPQKLDDILTLAAAGRLRIKADVPDAGERRHTRNRTVSLVASLVTLVALTFLVRHLSPAYGADLEWMGAVLVLVVGGWLLAAAANL